MTPKNPSIILVRPQLPENIGMVARVMHNFGLKDLIVISPRENWLNDKSINAAKKATKIIKNIKVGETFISKNEKITFEEVKTNEKKNYSSIIGTFEVKNKNNKIIKLYPEIRIYNQPVIATSEAAIKTTLFKDRFITINLIKDEQLFNVRYQNKPFMIWIWISTLIIIFGGTFAVFSKKKNYS